MKNNGKRYKKRKSKNKTKKNGNQDFPRNDIARKSSFPHNYLLRNLTTFVDAFPKNIKISSILRILVFMLILIFIITTIKNKKSQTDIIENEEIAQEEIIQEPVKTDTTITMAITGDIMCHNTVYQDAYSSTTNTYDFSHMFENIKQYISSADIAVGNLETTFAGSDRGYSGYPTFNTPEALAYNLKDIGIDVVSTANNHCYDKGYSGLVSTIEYLDAAQISHTGTYKSEEDQNTILVEEVDGIKIAFLSFTYGTNGITVPSDKTYSVNLIDEALILSQISLAKEQNPDIICCCMHWGLEYKTTQNSEQESLADLLFENGVDIIIGNHPHVLEPMEKRNITLEDGTEKEVFVVYSLGNFISGQTYTYTNCSAILNLSITKTADSQIKINSATYTPIYTYRNTSVSTNKITLIDIETAIAEYEAGTSTNISSSLYNTLKSELTNVKTLLGEEIY